MIFEEAADPNYDSDEQVIPRLEVIPIAELNHTGIETRFQRGTVDGPHVVGRVELVVFVLWGERALSLCDVEQTLLDLRSSIRSAARVNVRKRMSPSGIPSRSSSRSSWNMVVVFPLPGAPTSLVAWALFSLCAPRGLIGDPRVSRLRHRPHCRWDVSGVWLVASARWTRPTAACRRSALASSRRA